LEEIIMSEPTIVSNPYPNTEQAPQKQQNSCWAACMAWYTKNVLGTEAYSEDTIWQMASFKAMYETRSTDGYRWRVDGKKYGSLETQELISFLQSTPWNLSANSFPTLSGSMIQTRLAKGPVFVGYYDLSGATWHVNVICGYDADLDMVVAMEPRSGQFMDKSIADFTVSSSFNVLGWRN
jgi:hypothetical protein